MDKGPRALGRDSKSRPTNLGSRSQRDTGGMKEHGLLRGKSMAKANVTNRDFKEETKVYQSIVKELGSIKNRVEKVNVKIYLIHPPMIATIMLSTDLHTAGSG